ncbi:hypothetical protein [Acidipropionibacterium acidipropionici]|uniref:hypothetical protein n=1 Tax=Acidipropionibacterium acidipropionici TaxID=1748 RepID=UPI00110BDE7C|nr:hypothetical protein [Acidipropionibacterium acidipropionici]QCV95642.1 hypothetical protein FEZ30_10600 [Acidipropionibacterium acidipropionici]
MASHSDETNYFILVYNRAKRALMQTLRYGTQADLAVADYSKFEHEYEKDHDVEVVLIGSDSLETVRRTHANYFGSNEVTDPRLRRILATVGAA